MAKNVVQIAHQYLGVPYVWGGSSPQGLDCSGFLQLVYKQMGINIPRVTYDQIKAGQAVNLKNIKPGDAVFIEPGPDGPGHVGMYIGHGMVQQSPHTGTVNSVMPLSSFIAGGLVGIRRYESNAGQALPPGDYSSAPQAVGVGGNAIPHPDTNTQQIGGHDQQVMQLVNSVLSRNANRQSLVPQINPITVHPALGGFNGDPLR